MNNADLSKRLYRAILGVVLDDELSADDLRRLQNIVNGDRLRGAVSQAIEVITGEATQPAPQAALKAETRGSQETKRSAELKKKSNLFLSPTEMFDLVKRRKVSKAKLLRLAEDIAPGSIPTGADEMTVRDIVQTFYVNSDPDDQNLLRKIVSGDFSGDPFLQGMSRR